MKETPGLRRTQQLFWDLITAPTGVRPAIDDLRRRGAIAPQEIEDVFAGDAALPAADRLDIYANMYFYRLLDTLREDFPRTAAATGGDRFHNLVTDYLLAHPSSHPSLRHLGRHLPEFIAGHALHLEFPYLGDLARLEWTRADLFDAPDVPPLRREDLAALPQDRSGEAVFRLVPACALLRTGYDVARLWRDLGTGTDGETPNAAAGVAPGASGGTAGNAAAEEHDHGTAARGPRSLPRRPGAIRVWRDRFVVYHKAIDDEEADCLERIREGDDLGSVCQRLAAGRSPARATERVGRMLQSWLDAGLLAGFDLPGA